MISMTGFGHGEQRDAQVQMVVEIRSYNNRFLELFINLPYSLKQLEPRVREYLSSRMQRGKVEFYLSITELEDHSGGGRGRGAGQGLHGRLERAAPSFRNPRKAQPLSPCRYWKAFSRA